MLKDNEFLDLFDNKRYEINNIYDFFDNKEIKSKIFSTLWINDFLDVIVEKYKDKSLDAETQRTIEKISHYYIAKLLYEKDVIGSVEEFSSSNKTLKSCFKGKIDDIKLLRFSLMPVIFSSIKEHFLWWNSWQDYLDRFSEENLMDILNTAKERSEIEDFSLLKPSELSNKKFISEIRNALDHTRYVFWSEALYIKNPKNTYHKQEFEKEIPYAFLLLFILNLPHFIPKNSLGISLCCDDEEIFSNSKNLKFSDYKDSLHIYQHLAEWKYEDDTIIKNREIFLSKYLIGDVWEVVEEHDFVEWGDEKIKSRVLEEWWLLTSYFNKEKLDSKHLEYVLVSLWMSSLTIPMSILVYLLFVSDNSYKWLKSSEFMDKAYDFLYLIFSDYFTGCGVYKNDMDNAIKNYHLNIRGDNNDIWDTINYSFSSEKDKILDNIRNNLRIAKQESNGQSVMKTIMWCRKYVYSYLMKCGFKDEWDIFQKWEIKITLEELVNLCYFTCGDYFAISWIIETFPNRLKVQMIKMVYLNELIPLQKSGKKGRKSEEEHIRNALAHDNYTILAWVDQIVLRDGYSRGDDKWNRERIYKLSELYESTYKAMDDNMKNIKLNFDWSALIN